MTIISPLALLEKVPNKSANFSGNNTTNSIARLNQSTINTQTKQTDVQSLNINDYNAWIDQMLIDKGLYKQSNKDLNGDGVVDENDKEVKKANITTEEEANFADYGAALDIELKNAIINGGFSENESEGIDEDEKAIYNKLAGIFQNQYVLKTNDFMSYARQMGFEVSGQYMETGYIVDNKSGSEYTRNNKSIKEGGHIYVMTITDPNTGADIVIADANGNASIEVEELFLNEILTGLSSQIDPSQFGTYTASASKNNSQTTGIAPIAGEIMNLSAGSNNWIQNEKIQKEEKTKEKEAKEEENIKQQKAQKEATTLTQREYNQLEEAFIEEYIEELKEDSDYSDLTDKELEKMAQKEAGNYMKNTYLV